MSKTLSVLIVENFVINEGPKWEKFKKGIKKVGRGTVGAKGKKKKQTNESLKERLNLVKSGMSLNEESVDTIILIELEKKKERESDGHTPESIASLHNVPVQDILDQIEIGIKVEREHTSDEAEARLIAMDHLVELPDYYTRLDKMEEEGLQELEQEKKSLKEKLKLIKSGMFLNEESADVASLRNKISQGLILLPGLKGSAANKMEDSIRG